MSKVRIKNLDSIPQIIDIMCGNNTPSKKVCYELMEIGAKVDPDDIFEGLSNLLQLDTLNIWDEKIGLLWSDVCNKNASYMIAILRAYQLGQLAGATEKAIKHAIDHKGEGIDIEAVVKAVQKRLPNFKPMIYAVVADPAIVVSDTIDITGLDKAAVLAALYNSAKPQGMGFLQYNPQPMTVEEARKAFGNESAGWYFDYLRGRVMKVDLGKDIINVRNYDRDNGKGAAAAALASLRKTGDVNNEVIANTHDDNTFFAAMETKSKLGSVSGFITDPSEKTSVFSLGFDDVADKLKPKLDNVIRKATKTDAETGDVSELLCQCDSFCTKSIFVPFEEALKVNRTGLVVILDDCEFGPSSNDELVEKHTGYSLYKEKE